LERAKHVLLSDKLRKQYDLLGLDLEEDDHADESHQEDEDGNTGDEKKDSGTPDGVLGQMASSTVAAFLQMAVRTGEFLWVRYIISQMDLICSAILASQPPLLLCFEII
jgi:hypothetical protein